MKMTQPLVLSSLMLAGSLQAAIVTIVTDEFPGNTAALIAPDTLGIAVAVATPTGGVNTTYTVSGDLSSYGGGVGQTLVFNIDYTATGGNPTINGFSNIAVDGGTNVNQIESGETLTATVAFDTPSSTFSGDFANLSIGFTRASAGGVNDDETWDVVHDSGTFEGDNDNRVASFTSSGSFTFESILRDLGTAGINLQVLDVQIVAVPEPSTAALLVGLVGITLVLRRRKCK